jgi:uncharacterized iron-regulated membrane protein
MRKNLRLSMAWLHTWAGLVVGWLLFATFLTGTASYFRQEISLWTRPELPVVQTTDAEAAANAIRWLQRSAPNAVTWMIDLPDERTPVTRVFWRNAGSRPGFTNELLGPATGEKLTARATRGGDFFYYFHFDLGMPYPIGRWLVGLCASIMLVAIVSGIVTHRRFFKDFFTFRSGLGQRSWLDAHNATAVLALPFHIVITYSGLMTLMFMYFPFGVTAAYGTDRAAFDAALFQTMPAGKAVGRSAALTAIGPLLAEADRQWHGGRAGRITVNSPGDAAAEIQIRRRDGDRVNRLGQAIDFDGVTGALRHVSPEGRLAAATYGTLYGLHMARFAAMPLRFALFICGLMGSMMVASGLVLWAVKRRAKHAKAETMPFGLRLVERLNVGALAGLPIAMAVFFWANRLLPVDMATRSLWEQRCFLIAWVAGFLHPLLRPASRAWKEQLWLGALLWTGLPVLNALTTSVHLGVTLRNGDWGRAGVDIGAVILGIVLASLALKLGRRGRVRTRDFAPDRLAAAAGGS